VKEELRALRAAALAEIAGCRTEAELESVRVRFLGKKGSLTAVLRGLGAVPPADRPAMGALVNETKQAVEAALGEAGGRLGAARLARTLAEDRLDVTVPGRAAVRGRIHPLRAVEEEIVDIFLSMGFSVADGPEVEDDYHNFGALNFPPDHPARDMQDTLFVDDGDDALLRTHTSPVQIRVMRARKPPLRCIMPGTVYRRDELDPTHSPMFNQVEGLMVDDRVSFADLKGVLIEFLRKLFGPATGVRFHPTFFPFTEPSAQIDISCTACGTGGGKPGCRICRGGGWLEIMGAGMVHPNVLRAVDYDPEALRGFAFGMGIERLAVLFHGLDDLRLLYDNDLRFLSQFSA
jgi:phenylalanyl-tRNA synthetase alpha chain